MSRSEDHRASETDIRPAAPEELHALESAAGIGPTVAAFRAIFDLVGYGALTTSEERASNDNDWAARAA